MAVPLEGGALSLTLGSRCQGSSACDGSGNGLRRLTELCCACTLCSPSTRCSRCSRGSARAWTRSDKRIWSPTWTISCLSASQSSSPGLWQVCTGGVRLEPFLGYGTLTPPPPPPPPPADAHPGAHKSVLELANPTWTRSVHLDAPGQRHGQQPVSGTAEPGVVKQDKSSGGSIDTTKTRSDPQRVRMSSGGRPIGAAKGKQPNIEALCQTPRPHLVLHLVCRQPRSVNCQLPSVSHQPPSIGWGPAIPDAVNDPSGRVTAPCLRRPCSGLQVWYARVPVCQLLCAHCRGAL